MELKGLLEIDDLKDCTTENSFVWVSIDLELTQMADKPGGIPCHLYTALGEAKVS